MFNRVVLFALIYKEIITNAITTTPPAVVPKTKGYLILVVCCIFSTALGLRQYPVMPTYLVNFSHTFYNIFNHNVSTYTIYYNTFTK
jgi:hypothetical protein